MATSVEWRKGGLFIDSTLITSVVDSDKCTWYRGNDIAAALGYSSASYLISKHVALSDKLPFREIQKGKNCQSSIKVDQRNVFVNIAGLKSILSSVGNKTSNVESFEQKSFHAESRNTASGSNKDSQYEQPQFDVSVRSGKLFFNGRLIVHVVDSYGVKWFKSKDVTEALGFKNATAFLSKYVDHLDIMTLKEIVTDEPLPADRRCIFINSKGLKSFLGAFHASLSEPQFNLIQSGVSSVNKRVLENSRDKVQLECSKTFIVISSPGSGEHVISEMSLAKLMTQNDVIWKRQTCGGKLFEIITFLLAPWYDSGAKIYKTASSRLVNAVSQISIGYETTKKSVNELLKGAGSSKIPHWLSDGEVKRAANVNDSSGRLGWIYIASNDSYAKRNVFKVGSTTRLLKRLNCYQTGLLQEDFFHYYWFGRVFDCGKIDNLILHFLNARAQKVEKNGKTTCTELYKIDFEQLKKIVVTIIRFYESSRQLAYYQC